MSNSAKKKGTKSSVMRSASLLAIYFFAAGCGTPEARIEELARSEHMQHIDVEGRGFRHSIYANASARNDSAGDLWIYIEGDGSPVEIIRDGNEASIRPSSNPTARNPLALRLAARSATPSIYVTRPCYDEHHTDRGCADRYWTSERYSRPIVASLAASIQRYAGNRPVTLVGYSGGGVLAVLVANELPTTHTVITIAANLDIDAWTRSTSCLPASLAIMPETAGCAPFIDTVNPTDLVRSRHWQEFALVGGKDAIAPQTTAARYFARNPDVVVWKYDTFDHVCCWVDAWPEIVKRLSVK